MSEFECACMCVCVCIHLSSLGLDALHNVHHQNHEVYDLCTYKEQNIQRYTLLCKKAEQELGP